MTGIFEISLTELAIKIGVLVTMCLLLFRTLSTFLKKRNTDNRKAILSLVRTFLTMLVVYNILVEVVPLKGLMKGLVASSGIIALGISLAAQNSVGNLVSGLIILFTKPFKIGDLIKIDGGKYIGYVEDITLRHTVIRTYELNRIAIPNTTINNSPIENAHLVDSEKANRLEIEVSYESDLDQAAAIITELALAHEKNVRKSCDIRYVSYNENGITIRATVYSADSLSGFDMLSDLRHDIKIAFDKAGIVIPYPTRTVYLKNEQQ